MVDTFLPSGQTGTDNENEALDEVFEEIARMLEAGESVDIQAYAEKHPRQADAIRREMLESSLTFYRDFIEQRRDDPELRLETALAWRRVAEIYFCLSPDSEARAAYCQAITMLNDLSRAHPESSSYRAELARTHKDLSLVSRWPEKVEHARRAVTLAREVFAQAPDDIENRRLLAEACNPLAMWLKNSDRRNEAEDLYLEALTNWGKLVEHREAVPQDLVLRLKSLSNYAGLLRTGYRFVEAEKPLLECVRLGKEMLAKTQHDPVTAKYNLANAMGELGSLLNLMGRFDEGEACYRQSIEILEPMAADFPNRAVVLRRSGETYRDLSGALLAQGRFPEAEEALVRSLDLAKQGADLFPTRTYEDAEVGTVHYRLATLFYADGRTQEATLAFSKAQQLFEDHARVNPKQPSSRWRSVLLLSTCPAPEFRRPDEAVRYARLMTQAGPENGRWWHLLGVAQYAAGSWQAAVESLNKSIELRRGGDAFDRLFLAMAHWRAGNNKKALERYDEAVHYIEDRNMHLSRDFTVLDLERFRAEAEALKAEYEGRM